MKNATPYLRSIRVPACVHLQAKLIALGDGTSLSQFVAAALEREVERRLRETAVDSSLEQPPHAR